MKRRRALIIALAIITAVIGGGALLFIEFARTMREVENFKLNSFAMYHVCSMVGTYVEKHNAWPRSWEDLYRTADEMGETTSPSETRLDQRVMIDFNADLKVIREQDAAEFTAIGLKDNAGIRVSMEHIEHLLTRLRGPVEWKKPGEVPDQEMK